MSNFVTNQQFTNIINELRTSSIYKINNELSPTFSVHGMTLVPLWANGDLNACQAPYKDVYPTSSFPEQTLELLSPISFSGVKNRCLIGLYITCCIQAGANGKGRHQASSVFVPNSFNGNNSTLKPWSEEDFTVWGTGNTGTTGVFCLRRFHLTNSNSNKIQLYIGPGYIATKGAVSEDTGSSSTTLGTYEVNTVLVPLIIQGVLISI